MNVEGGMWSWGCDVDGQGCGCNCYWGKENVDVDGSSNVKSISSLYGVCLVNRWIELKVTVEVVRGCSRGEEWGDSYREIDLPSFNQDSGSCRPWRSRHQQPMICRPCKPRCSLSQGVEDAKPVTAQGAVACDPLFSLTMLCHFQTTTTHIHTAQHHGACAC
jgi:hypothetical protein